MSWRKQAMRAEISRRLVCWVVQIYIRLVYATGRWRVEGGHIPRRLRAEGRPFILAFWHGRLLMMPMAWQHLAPMHMLISGHADGRIIPLPLDIRDGAAVEQAVARIEDEIGAIDMLANVAGVLRLGTVEQLSDEDWLQSFAVNTHGVFFLSRAVARRMQARRRGGIVTVGSNAAAGYQLATQEAVMPIGGFNGSDPSPTLAQFKQYVAEGRIHYFIAGGVGGRSNGGSSASSEIASWVADTFSAQTVDGVTVYDLTS